MEIDLTLVINLHSLYYVAYTYRNCIWKTGKWPEDWKGSTFIPIFKKGDARSCDNYRTI